MATAIPAIHRSTAGKKAVMAVTGFVFVGFLISHMVGNLKVFSGADSFNEYAHWLREVGYPAVPKYTLLTVMRLGMVVALVLHVWAAVSLALRARQARPVKYEGKRKSHAQGYATRTMRWGGVVIFLFVIWHLLDMTFSVVNPAGSDGTPYQRVVEGFDPSRWPITLFYVVAVLLAGMHIQHGFWSAFQSLGLRSPRNNAALRALAFAIASVIVIGFVSVPVAVTFGWVS